MTAPYRFLRRTARAVDRPVDVAAAKKALRIEHGTEDDVLGAKLDAAEDIVATKTGRILRPTDFELLLTHPDSSPIDLGAWPIRDVAEVAYRNAAGDWIDVGALDFEFVRHDDERGAVEFFSTFAPASVISDRANMRVRFSAGYGDAGDGADADPELELPPRAREALLLLAGHFFEHREAVTAVEMVEVPLSAAWALESLRIFR